MFLACLQVALSECCNKHRGANAALYGRLGYLLLTVTAGDLFAVYAMRLEGSYDTEVLVPPFSVSPGHALFSMGLLLWEQSMPATDVTTNLVPGPSPWVCFFPAAAKEALLADDAKDACLLFLNLNPKLHPSWSRIHGVGPLLIVMFLSSKSCTLIPCNQARDLPGRCKALLTFINITRWLRTLHCLRVLPPSPTLTLLEEVERPSPFQGGGRG
jgi:hypothetical protein